ncbi:3D domain-containing protein [Paenibacillus sp. LHD-117]|uniref:3D domain-containing protein n=1 Tax=Paenibacillus sp. LHD-117 TaxID=3071412 RepID=UPI0027E0F107|nr:3D domain-containing protein [Paenibacillus sp. LHD-117]MDQ6419810.1 3D domain-containing protein [Paenibacillus sp. LHD-117]
MKKWMITTAAIAVTATIFAGNAQAAEQTHKIENNDTFWEISLQYKVPLKQLMDANDSMDPLNLKVGADVVIPGNEAGEKESAKKVTAQSTPAPAQPIAMTVTAPGGTTYTYKKQMKVKATAYTAAASENGKWGAVDYFGNKLKVGTIAVDPKMIPLGTKLYVTGYDYDGLPQGGMVATATDMGGSIKGNRIDIFVPGTTQQASKFGFQDVKVFILN